LSGSAVATFLYWLYKTIRDWSDSQRIYDFLTDSIFVPPFLFSLCYAVSRAARNPRDAPRVSSSRRVSAGGYKCLYEGCVIHRRGELTKAAIDRGWPHQIALPSARCSGANYVTMRLFCEGLSLCDCGHSYYRDGTDMTVFCFAQREHAELFRERLCGDFLDPKDRPRWPGSR
jgi:hypothetical protein